jgi:hypothetical protein
LMHVCTAHAQKGRILLPVSDLTMPFDPAWSKTYIVMKCGIKTQF